MGISFFLKKAIFTFRTAFSLFFCYEISATALAGRFCVARGTRDTKIQVIEVSVSSLYISPLWYYVAGNNVAGNCVCTAGPSSGS
jgi:hypothetical protein